VRSLVPRSAKKPARAARPSKKPAIKLVPSRPAAKSRVEPTTGLKRIGFTAAPRSNKPAVTRVALVPGTATREECLKRYLPLVRYVVERVASALPHYVDHEDLHSAGVLGLLNAYDKFDAKKGNKFETYAVWRIKGAVLDQLRSLDWASRSTRRLGREAEAWARRLDQKLGRTATDREIARAMKLPLIEYHRLMDRVRGSVLLSLDETRENEDGDSLGLAEVLEDPRAQEALGRLEEEETKGLLRATLNRLPEQERLVIALYYYEQMTLREIGEALGISESRVSQVHTRAVERLRGRVERALAS
jgi:RNA polymerase sigma factor FliA